MVGSMKSGIYFKRGINGEYYFYTVAGRKLEPKLKNAIAELTRMYALSRNRLDADLIRAKLAEDIVFGGQHTIDEIEGIDNVHMHLKWQYAEHQYGEMEIGEIDSPHGRDYPCAIYSIDGKRRSVIQLSVDGNGKISRIYISTMSPTHMRLDVVGTSLNKVIYNSFAVEFRPLIRQKERLCIKT